MKTSLIFSLEGNEALADRLSSCTETERGYLEQKKFPDGETYIRVLTDVKNRCVFLACTLNEPDPKFLALALTAQTMKKQGAAKIVLVAPYLPYMRQDRLFREGEALSSDVFARLLSGTVDELITVDPHLHRHKSLSEIYSIPCHVLHASSAISRYVSKTIPRPVLIGPDSESEQWVKEVAREAGAAFLVLEKVRHGDRDVRISMPEVSGFAGCTPVLIDDIVSTARTMIETVMLLRNTVLGGPVCIAVHAVFSGDACEELKAAGAAEVLSCNTIVHPSNRIDLTEIIGTCIGRITREHQ